MLRPPGADCVEAGTPDHEMTTPLSRKQRAIMTLRPFQPGTAEYQDALRLREQVLRKPLGLSLTDAELARDAGCFHLRGFEDDWLVAVLLLQPLDASTVQMRQVAVRATLQRTGCGSQLIAYAEGFARQQGYGTMVAHARATALGFYLRLGYTAVGDEFIETTVPHQGAVEFRLHSHVHRGSAVPVSAQVSSLVDATYAGQLGWCSAGTSKTGCQLASHPPAACQS